jgi:hypothetical protein
MTHAVEKERQKWSRGQGKTRSPACPRPDRNGGLRRRASSQSHHTLFCFVRPILSRFNKSDDVRSPNFGPVADN